MAYAVGGMFLVLLELPRYPRKEAPDYPPGAFRVDPPEQDIPLPAPGGTQGCGATIAAQTMTGVPLPLDQVAIEDARDRYLSTTLAGRYIIEVFYANQTDLQERAAKTELSPEHRALAQSLYARYAGGAKLSLADPDRDDLRIGEQHFRDAEAALMAAEPYLSADEKQAATQALELAKPVLGMNLRECLGFLNRQALLDEMKSTLGPVKFLKGT